MIHVLSYFATSLAFSQAIFIPPRLSLGQPIPDIFDPCFALPLVTLGSHDDDDDDDDDDTNLPPIIGGSRDPGGKVRLKV